MARRDATVRPSDFLTSQEKWVGTLFRRGTGILPVLPAIRHGRDAHATQNAPSHCWALGVGCWMLGWPQKAQKTQKRFVIFVPSVANSLRVREGPSLAGFFVLVLDFTIRGRGRERSRCLIPVFHPAEGTPVPCGVAGFQVNNDRQFSLVSRSRSAWRSRKGRTSAMASSHWMVSIRARRIARQLSASGVGPRHPI